MEIVFIIGFVQAFFIGMILLNKKNKSLSDKILAVWIFEIGLHLLLYYLDYAEYYDRLPHLLGLIVPLPLVAGPFLLMYVDSLISKKQKFNRLMLIHFAPAIIYYIFISPIMLMSAEDKMHYVYEIMPVEMPLYFDVFGILISLSGPIYVLWSMILLRKHYVHIKEEFSYTEKINLKWLRNLIGGMALIWTLVLVGDFLDEKTASMLIFTSVTIFVFIIGYYGTRQGVIFTDQKILSAPNEEQIKKKYEKSPLDVNQSKSMFDQLLKFMKESKPYLESKITLRQLAEQIDTTPNYLSQVINENLNQNFYDFVNKYRVDEFKQKLEGDTAMNYTLFGHARDCGFSSKSSFHEVFKKHTGQTPSKYLSNLRHPSVSQ